MSDIGESQSWKAWQTSVVSQLGAYESPKKCRKCPACGRTQAISAFSKWGSGFRVVCRWCEDKLCPVGRVPVEAKRSECGVPDQWGLMVKALSFGSSAVKRCTSCWEFKAVDDFPVRRASPDGRRPICRPCASAYSSARYAKNRSVIDAYQREYRKTPQGWAKDKRYNDRQSEEVTDVYVRKVLRHACGEVAALLPAEILDAKRQHIKLNRELKGAKR